MPKPRIALVAMGIIGGGPIGQGVPVLKDLFTRLSSDFEITFYCLEWLDKRYVPSQIKMRRPLKWRWVPGRIKFVMVFLLFALDQFFSSCDLIFSVSDYPAGRWSVLFGRIFRKKVVVQFIAYEAVSLPSIGYGSLHNPAKAKITRHVVKEADGLIMVAEYQAEIARKALPTERDICVLPLRIDTTLFPFHEKLLSFPVEFIHVAYYSALKDQETMFRTFSEISKHIDCRLTVVGDGYDTDQILMMLRELNIGDKVKFAGNIYQEKLTSYLSKAHFMLHTALFETGCAVIQEAMASGVVVGGTRVGILSDLGDRYALIVEPGDFALLAEKILSIIRTPAEYERMKMDSYQWISTFDARWSAENYRNFLSEILRS
jgi:glycosyltransferase involved in cell wall biosynthesis